MSDPELDQSMLPEWNLDDLFAGQESSELMNSLEEA